MSIKSIKIKNLLSFDELIIDNFKDINCIIGKNNSGKSNLLKLIRFFYNRLEGKRELPPQLNSNYSVFGTIAITYSISDRIKTYLEKKEKKYFENNTIYELTLKIYSNDSIEWSTNDKKILDTINYIYPFFDIEARHIDLYNWDKLWHIISKLKSFKLEKLEKNLFHKENENNREFNEFIKLIDSTIDISKYTYKDKLLAYIKSGISGDKFVIGTDELITQSDGTNAHKFIELSLRLLIVLSKREYITPIIYIDEPEIGLHPKKNEELIENVYDIYKTEKRNISYPTIIFATHSPNIVKQVIKLFDINQQILHFSKKQNKPTVSQVMYSQYNDKRFLNIFSDNEARLFFSNFILFVEGDTELEVFRNAKLLKQFPILKIIDVYQSGTNVTLENINPSYAKTSIPYLLLFDADKIYKFKRPNSDKSKREIILQKNGNLYDLKNEILNKTKFFYDKKKNEIYVYINTVIEFTQKKYDFDNFLFSLKKEKEYLQFTKDLNKYLINIKNIYSVKTTIEETLINNMSKSLFFEWISNEYNFDKNKIKEDILDDNILINYIRLFFGGKFEIQVDYSFLEKDNDKTKKSKKLFELIKKNQKFPSQREVKTSGWATSFLNFSIDKIEKNRGENEFKEEFKKYFRELYDIITIIENKL